MTIVGIVVAVSVLIFVFLALRDEKIREKYAILWIVLSLAVLVVSIFPKILENLADVLGVALPSNLLFAIAVGLLALIILHLTWEQSKTEKQIRALAEEIAILKANAYANDD